MSSIGFIYVSNVMLTLFRDSIPVQTRFAPDESLIPSKFTDESSIPINPFRYLNQLCKMKNFNIFIAMSLIQGTDNKLPLLAPLSQF